LGKAVQPRALLRPAGAPALHPRWTACSLPATAACRRRAGRVPQHHGGPPGRLVTPAARPKIPGPYDGQPFAPIGALSAAEHAWGRGLLQRCWPTLGWCVVGRDSAGRLVAATVLPCGAADGGRRERHCHQTFTPAGLVYRSTTDRRRRLADIQPQRTAVGRPRGHTALSQADRDHDIRRDVVAGSSGAYPVVGDHTETKSECCSNTARSPLTT